MRRCAGPDGPQGERGEEGDRGSRGIDGQDGEPGAPGASGQSVTYATRFHSESDVSTWNFTENGVWRIQDGRLEMSGSTEFINIARPKSIFDDFDMSVEVEWLEGAKDEVFGLAFRISLLGQYGFSISDNGTYLISEWEPFDQNVPPENLIASRSNVVTQGGVNLLQVRAVGPRFDFYINDVLVESVIDSTLSSGFAGIWVSGLQEVAFDNLLVGVTQPLLKPVAE